MYTYTSVEWFSLFSIFENGHIAIDCLYYFYELISKKSENFIFKNHRYLENIFFFLNFQNPSFYKKEQLLIIEFKMWIKTFFLQVSLCFLLFNKKGNSFVSVETFKHVKSNFFLHSTLIYTHIQYRAHTYIMYMNTHYTHVNNVYEYILHTRVKCIWIHITHTCIMYRNTYYTHVYNV